GLRKQYEEFHGVRYRDEAIRAAAELSAKYLHDRRMPDKAIDLIDETGAARKLGLPAGAIDGAASDLAQQPPRDPSTETPVVEVSDVERVLARMAQIPPREVSA